MYELYNYFVIEKLNYGRRSADCHFSPATTHIPSLYCINHDSFTFPHTNSKMVLQDLGRRINAAVSDLTRSTNLDEKVGTYWPPGALL